VPIKIDRYTVWESGWTFIIRPPLGLATSRVIVLIHGWTGDEHSMNIFANQLSEKDALLFPRGPVKAMPKGFGWIPFSQTSRPTVKDLEPAVNSLLKLIDYHSKEMEITNPQLALIGFSQGASVAFALAALHPTRIDRIASLAGFMPEGFSPQELDGLSRIPFYIAHGEKDETVPVNEARKIVSILQSIGSQVVYCESNTGHKLSSKCIKGLTEFFE